MPPMKVILTGEQITELADVAWWKFAEGSGTTTADSTSNAHAGTLTNGPTWVAGLSGTNAISFDGTNQYVATTLTNLNFAAGSVTWWMKPSTAFNAGTVRGIWGQQTSGIHSPEFSAQVFSDNNWYIGWNAPGADHRVVLAASSGNYVSGSWAFYSFTWSGAGSKLYKDGSLIGSVGTAPSVSDVGDPFEIARTGSLVSTYFPGAIEAVRIYSRELAGSEITTLFGNGPE